MKVKNNGYSANQVLFWLRFGGFLLFLRLNSLGIHKSKQHLWLWFKQVIRRSCLAFTKQVSLLLSKQLILRALMVLQRNSREISWAKIEGFLEVLATSGIEEETLNRILQACFTTNKFNNKFSVREKVSWFLIVLGSVFQLVNNLYLWIIFIEELFVLRGLFDQSINPVREK